MSKSNIFKKTKKHRHWIQLISAWVDCENKTLTYMWGSFVRHTAYGCPAPRLCKTLPVSFECFVLSWCHTLKELKQTLLPSTAWNSQEFLSHVMHTQYVLSLPVLGLLLNFNFLSRAVVVLQEHSIFSGLHLSSHALFLRAAQTGSVSINILTLDDVCTAVPCDVDTYAVGEIWK